MARTGGYRGKGSYGTGGQIGSGATINPSLRGGPVPESVVKRGPQAVSEWRAVHQPRPKVTTQAESWAKIEAMMAKSAAESRAAAASKASGRAATAAPAATPEVAQPMSTPEERWINRARAAGDDTRSDAELRQQYRDRVAARDAKAAAVSPPADPAAAPRAPTPKTKPASGAPTAKRQAAIDAYTKAFDKAPSARMSIKAMDQAVEVARVVAGRQAARKEQIAGIFGEPVSQAKADAAATSARAKFDAKMAGKAAPSSARQAAMNDYKATVGIDPPPGASIKGMREKIAVYQTKREAIARDTLGPNWKTERPDFVGTDAAKARGAQPPAATPPARKGVTYGQAMTALGLYGTGVQAVNTFHRSRAGGANVRDAALDAAEGTAVPLGIMAAPHIARGAGHVANGAFEVTRLAGDAMLANPFITARAAEIGLLAGGLGIAAKGVELAAKTVGRVALPAVVGWSAYQGAKEDDNKVRGAARGAIRGLDPTSLLMARGLGERAFDAAFGAAKPKSVWETTPRPPFQDVFRQEMGKMRDRFEGKPEPSLWEKMWKSTPQSGQSGSLTPQQQKQFAGANAAYGRRQQTAAKPDAADGRGWANPAVQAAAQQARGVQNVTAWAANGDAYDPNKLGVP